MSVERLKSIFLTVLVLLSFILTWGLWTYQPQYDSVQNTNYIQNVSIGEQKEITEVISPIQLVYHTDDKDLGSINQNEITLLYDELRSWEIKMPKLVSRETNRRKIGSHIPAINNSVELIFSTGIPKEVVQLIFTFEDDSFGMKEIDRIFIPFESENDAIYFMSLKEEKVLKAGVDGARLDALIREFKPIVSTFPELMSIESGENDLVFLPKQSPSYNKLSYSSYQLSGTELKNALFSNPSVVRQYSSKNDEESFTDAARALEIFYSDNKMRYINPTPEMITMSAEEIVVSSVDFINEHAGWTDDYLLFDWSEKHQSSQFRLFVQGYPVFTSDERHGNGNSLIYQTWRNHEIYEYVRSIINLRFLVQSEQSTVELLSGEELLSYLKAEKNNFSTSHLKSAFISYEMKASNPMVVTFEPAWFILYDGVWEKVDVDQGGNRIGVE